MTWLLAIDPGPTESAWLEYRDGVPVAFAKEANAQVLDRVSEEAAWCAHFAIELVQGYGMPVGAEVFDTCVFAGRLIQAWAERMPEDTVLRVYRKDVKRHLCGTTTAKDQNVRQALIDRYGPGKRAALGLKASPGPLYGVSGDVWAALALAVTAADELNRVAPSPRLAVG